MTSSARKLISDRVKSVSLSQSLQNITTSLTQKPLEQQDRETSKPITHRVHLRKRKASQHPLRELRVKAGMTLEELSQATSMSPSYLSRLESGSRRLNEDIISRLSKALRCIPGDLLTSDTTAKKTTAADVFMTTHHTNAKPDMPVFLIKTVNQDAPVISTKAEEMIYRPSDYIGVKNAFACKLEASLWSPRYQKEDIILLNPYAPLKEGCSIMVRTKKKDVYIGTYKPTEGEGLPTELTLVTAYSPDKKEIIFPLKNIEAFRITGTIER